MTQIFHPSTNTIAKVSIFGGIFILAALCWILSLVNQSSLMTGVNIALDQPVPFSHKHHVTGLGIDCRYCHASVEQSSFAGVPSTKTCINCHSMMWADSPVLGPVRESFRTGKPLEWTRVQDLADFVYFDHSIHIQKGIGCVSCHGQIDQMPLTWRKKAFFMNQCIECHQAPEKFVRPREEVFNPTWKAGPNRVADGIKLVKTYNIRKMTDCSVCHR